MPNKIASTARAIFAATFLIVLNACVYGVPIISPVDVALIAAATSSVTAETTDSNWPFASDTEILELKCGGLSTKIELTPRTALVTMPDRDMRFTRSVGADETQRLAYWDAVRIQVDDIGILASEDGQGLADFYFSELIILDAHSAELDLDSGSFRCGVE